MLYIYLPVLYYHGNLYVTEWGLCRPAGFPLSLRSFLLPVVTNTSVTSTLTSTTDTIVSCY